MSSVLPELARLSAERMLNGMTEGLVVALGVWALLRIVGRRNASTRFAVWFVALLAIAALPWLGSLRASSGSVGEGHSAITMPGSWALNLFLAWAVVASLALLRVGVGLWQLRKLRAGSKPADLASLDAAARNTLEEFQRTRRVTLAVSDELRVPTAIGFFKPMVVLPAWAVRELSAEELNSILIHELAHLRRRDDWTNLAQKLLHAILFFHPAVWWVERQLSLEREMACDDVVLSRTRNPRAYAECLVSVAEKSFVRRGLALAQAAVSQVRQTSMRVLQILDRDRPGAIRVWKPAVGLVGVVSIASVIGLGRAPQLVAFRDSVPAVSMASAVVPPAIAMNSVSKTTALSPAKRTRPAPQPKPVVARNTPQPAGEWQAFETSFVEEAEGKAGPRPSNAGVQTVFVVMQTRQWDGSGSGMWSISVWRLTVLKANQVPVAVNVPAKSI